MVKETEYYDKKHFQINTFDSFSNSQNKLSLQIYASKEFFLQKLINQLIYLLRFLIRTILQLNI